jgi:ectoine hydroxylase-related dioxygenase (phytanoyl-CoA dioxygenase family)
LNYWGLDADDLVTAWLALSPATVESGCMRVLPGSHAAEMLPHDDTFQADNMLTRGQEIAVQVDESMTRHMPLRPGEMSVHNVRIAHASGPNASDDRRIGISVHYLPTASKQVVGDWDSAALVRGTDRHHHFEPTPIPAHDMDPVAVEFHDKAVAALRDILYRGAEQQTGRMG